MAAVRHDLAAFARDELPHREALGYPPYASMVRLVIRGKTNKQIANVLGATERTIKAHRHQVMEKMQVQSLAELVSIAERAGILRDTGQTT